MVGARAGVGCGQLVCDGDGAAVWEDEKVLDMDSGDGGTTP